MAREECEECGRVLKTEDEELGCCARCGLVPLTWDCRHDWAEIVGKDGEIRVRCRTCGLADED